MFVLDVRTCNVYVSNGIGRRKRENEESQALGGRTSGNKRRSLQVTLYIPFYTHGEK